MAPPERIATISPDKRISSDLLRSWIPKNWAAFWQNPEILNGNEHDMVHHLVVLHNCYRIGKFLETKGVQVDYEALIEFALTHDVRRLSDRHDDTLHAVRASRFLAGLSTLVFSKYQEFSPASHQLAQAIVLYHDVHLERPVPKKLGYNPTFLTALLADRVALARYDGKIFNQTTWTTTLDHLVGDLPDNFQSLFEEDFLEKLLAENYNWHNAAQGKKAHGTGQIEATLTSGQELGILRP